MDSKNWKRSHNYEERRYGAAVLISNNISYI
jgi:hypothetical protein